MMYPTSNVPPSGNGVIPPEEELRSVKFVKYELDGRIDGQITEAVHFYRQRALAGQRVVLGEGQADTHYIVFVGEARAPVLQPRPELDRGFDKSEIAVREGTTISDLAPASVTFEGPVKGQHEHPGGDLVVGWTVPGTYTVTVEAFPYLPATFTLTVGAQS